ncbi:MAG: PAS domain-containing protein, partial [Bacteroidetes bacterium]
MGDPVFVKDSKSRLVLVNNAFCEMFELPREQIIGKTLAEDVSPEERDHFLRVDKQLLADGKESILEESLTVRGGATKTISTRKTRYIDEHGNAFLVGIIRDITERRESEELSRLNKLNEL